MNFDWASYKGNIKWLQGRTIFITIHGSIAYGLNTPESDLDIKGIAIPPVEYFLGYLQKFEQATWKEPDATIYDIRKFFQLASDCNPNIIEMLWTDEKDHLFVHPLGAYLLERREMFLSRKAKYTFSGYAIAQLKRIKTHRKWLLNPPLIKPTRESFQLPETSLLSADILGAITATLKKDASRIVEYPAHIMTLYHEERAYHNAMTEWVQYQNWKTTRNPKRAALEAAYGYDAKHASHLVRLMRMCREILTTGQVIVKRPDRDEILAIKQGAWSYDQLLEWAERQDSELTELEKTSPLRKEPDRYALNGMCCHMVEQAMKGQANHVAHHLQ